MEDTNQEEIIVDVKIEPISETDEETDKETEEIKKFFSYSCQSCGTRFSHKLGIELHNAGKLYCNECGIVVCVYDTLKSHICVPPPRPQCKNCLKSFEKEKILALHIAKEVCIDKILQCDQCDKVCTSNALLTKHKITHRTDKPYVCEVCAKAFAMKNRLKAHEKTHLGYKLFQCDICAKEFSSFGTLTKHQKTLHPDIVGVPMPFECEKCQKRFVYEHLLARHMVSHGADEASVKAFDCELCDKKFFHKNNLKQHHLTCHTNFKPFMCDKCCGKFSRKSTLMRHKCWLQLADRPHQCNKCGKSFSRKSYIRIHSKKCMATIPNTSLDNKSVDESVEGQKREFKVEEPSA